MTAVAEGRDAAEVAVLPACGVKIVADSAAAIAMIAGRFSVPAR